MNADTLEGPLPVRGEAHEIGIGGYVAAALLVYQGWSPFLTAPVAGLLGMALGIVVGLITLRFEPDLWAVLPHSASASGA